MFSLGCFIVLAVNGWTAKRPQAGATRATTAWVARMVLLTARPFRKAFYSAQSSQLSRNLSKLRLAQMPQQSRLERTWPAREPSLPNSKRGQAECSTRWRSRDIAL